MFDLLEKPFSSLHFATPDQDDDTTTSDDDDDSTVG